ncbi:hypothetical protein [Streptomyces decoyicus]|uniref:hypothetical protein n=1 Tax=Streptomyces decoyicus TaxID=249567 RepID=UPI0036537049
MKRPELVDDRAVTERPAVGLWNSADIGRAARARLDGDIDAALVEHMPLPVDALLGLGAVR